DATTEFSDAESLASREDFLTFKLAAKLRDDLGIDCIDEDVWSNLENILPDLFKDFAVDIAQESNSQLARNTMYYAYKNKQSITTSFLEPLRQDGDNQADVEVEPDFELLQARRERASLWALGTADIHEDSVLPNASDERASDTGDDESDFDSMEQEYKDYAETLDRAAAYQWLLGAVRRQIALADASQNLRGMVRRQLTHDLPRSKVSRHRQPPVYEVAITAEWDPRRFFQQQKFDESPDRAVQKLIVLVGSDTHAQAVTCEEYMIQTWSWMGRSTMDCFLELLRNGNYALRNSSSWISMALRDGTLIGTGCGTRAFVQSFSEQFVWLVAALQTSPDADKICFFAPSLSGPTIIPSAARSEQQADVAAALSYKVLIQPEPYSQELELETGRCWQSLFQNASVVKGYPIPRRSTPDYGLEISLSLMATLVEAQFLNVFRGTPMIKGFSTLLFPTKQTLDATIWHLTYNQDGSHISFVDGLSCYTPAIDIEAARQGRHILGWCKDAKLYAGAADAPYLISKSLLPEAHDGCILHGAAIQQGQLLKGVNYQLGTKDIPTRLGRLGSDSYLKSLQWLQTQRVVFWDEDEKRGWLINGVSGLLHLLRASIEYNCDSDFSDEFLLNADSLPDAKIPYTCKAAVEVLTKEVNKELKMFRNESEQFKDVVARFFNILEQMIAHQSVINKQCLTVPGSELPRRQLEGWDFSEFAEGRDPIDARFTEIPIIGRSWADFVRSMGAVVLFSRGFGDLIQPSASSSPCPWAQVPSGAYYLTCLVRDIQGLGQFRDQQSGKMATRIGSRFAWHNPGKVFEPCRCGIAEEGEHDSFVQVVLPAGTSEQMHLSENLGRPSKHGGAVILGHNPVFSWVWQDFGPPTLGNPHLFRDPPRRATPSSDSGYSSQAPGSNACPPAEPEIGIICALSKELKAVWALLDCVEQQGTNDNPYVFGHLGGYSVIAACLPKGEYGTAAAAAAATHMARSFPLLEFTLLIGIGGGIPSKANDVRLGDVVVGLPSNPQEHGLVQYDAGKVHQDRYELKRSSLQPPPRRVKNVVATIMEANPEQPEEPLHEFIQRIVQKCPEYENPGPDQDVLFEPNYASEVDCGSRPDLCTCKPQSRPERASTQPRIHYGTIASGNSVVKDAATRDELGVEYNAICVEMEAAGIANELQCLVIRGICDYADCHKNKIWQEYAAATAAAYAKYLL
ncbi:hypothetical protein Micbo1qcDRAFT_108023, partial [Microdochium bolleyi]